MLFSGISIELGAAGEECSGAISSVRLIPAGVISKAQERISASGNPSTTRTTTSWTVQLGKKNGKTRVATCATSHPATM